MENKKKISGLAKLFLGTALVVTSAALVCQGYKANVEHNYEMQNNPVYRQDFEREQEREQEINKTLEYGLH